MIKLYQFPSCWDIANPSPFCMKVETYLRMTKLPYEIVTIANPAAGPKHKLPFIVDKERKIGDSTLIINYLKQTYGDSLDKDLEPLEIAQSLALQHLIEEHLYWIIVYSRWMDEANWPTLKQAFFGQMPKYMRAFVSNMIRKQMRKALYIQGMGRHTQQEIYDFGKRDITAIATMLGESSFIFGEQPHTIDAIVHATIVNILSTPINCPLKEHAQTFMNLQQYCQRLNKAYYSEQSVVTS